MIPLLKSLNVMYAPLLLAKNYLRSLFVLLLLLMVMPAMAHHPDHSFIYMRIYEETGIEGRFELHVDELNEVLGLNLSKEPTVDEIKPYEERIRAYILDHASFRSVAGNHPIKFTGEISILELSFGSYVNLHFLLDDSEQLADELEVTFSVFLNENPNHINMLGVEYNWKAGLINNEAIMALEFTKGDSTQALDLTENSLWKGFMMMLRQGVWHIWIGLDHILFLLALILPSVVRRREEVTDASKGVLRDMLNFGQWKPVEKFRPAFIYIIKVITFFTIAHTITLSMAALEIVVLPSRFVESVIAASIGLAALHNIMPIFKQRDWIIAFGFGLFHGFGFASVLGDLGFRGEYLTLSLLGFNLGVEVGQVVIIALIFPVLYAIRKLWLYPRILIYLSLLLILIAGYWLLERAFDVDFALDDQIINFVKQKLYKLAVWLGLR
ncbi:MAG: HupE/UreJ family protein [Flavobacteriaceae bacterium]